MLSSENFPASLLKRVGFRGRVKPRALKKSPFLRTKTEKCYDL